MGTRLTDIRDNALYNTQTAANGGPAGAAGSYAIGVSAIGLYNFFTSNYNDLYSSGTVVPLLGGRQPPACRSVQYRSPTGST